MGKLALSFLLVVSAAANAFAYPTDTDQPITGLFGIILGIFAIMVTAVMSDHLPELAHSKKKQGQDFGGGGASGHW